MAVTQRVGEIFIQCCAQDGTPLDSPQWHVLLVEESDQLDEFGRKPRTTRMLGAVQAQTLGFNLADFIGQTMVDVVVRAERAEQAASQTEALLGSSRQSAPPAPAPQGFLSRLSKLFVG